MWCRGGAVRGGVGGSKPRARGLVDFMVRAPIVLARIHEDAAHVVSEPAWWERAGRVMARHRSLSIGRAAHK